MRILLKISGEALKNKDKSFGFDFDEITKVAKIIKKIKDNGHELAIVVGGGNIYRGSNLIEKGIKRSDSHNLSMLGTAFNGVVLKGVLEKLGELPIVMDSLNISFLEKYNKDKALSYLKKDKILIFVCGTGNPFFSTDTGGVLRALEIDADLMIKATKVNGIYDKDPVVNDDAKFLKKVTYDEFIKKDLKIMDTTGVVLAKENSLTIKITSLYEADSILAIIGGEDIGSTISA